MPTTFTPPRPMQPAARRPPLSPDVVGLIAVLLIAPLIALLASSAELETIGIVAAAVTLLLVVLWSPEATFYVLIFSMLLSPEFIVGDLGGPSAATASRGITLRLEDYVIAIISFGWLIRLAVFKEAALLRRAPLNLPVLAYIGFSALVTLWGGLIGNLSLTTGIFFVLKYLEYAFVYFLAINYVRDRRLVRRLLIAVLITAVLISLIGIAQIPAGGRVSAPFEGERGEPNTLGGYLVLIMAIALAYLGDARRSSQVLFWLPVVGLMMLPLAFTYSRTSWLAFGAMMVATIVLSRNRSVFFAMIAVVLVVFTLSPPQGLIERATYTLSSQRTSMEIFGLTIEPSAAARLQAWVIAAEALGRNPITGAGVTGAGLIDAQYPRVIAETGFIGMAIFIWMLWRLFRVGFDLRDRGRTRDEILLANGFIAGLCGLVVHGIGANTFIIVRIMEPMWMVAGLVVASLLIARDEDVALRDGAAAGDRVDPRLATAR